MHAQIGLLKYFTMLSASIGYIRYDPLFLRKRFHKFNNKYSGTSPYGHLTSKKTSQLQSPWLSPKLHSTVQITPCNNVTLN